MALYSIPETQGLLLNLELGWQQQASTIFLSLPSTMLGLQGLHIIPGFLCVSQEFKSSSSYLSSKRSYPLSHLLSPLCFFIIIITDITFYLFTLWRVACAQHVVGGQRTTCWSQISPSIMQGSEIKLRSSGSAASVFTCLLASYLSFLNAVSFQWSS